MGHKPDKPSKNSPRRKPLAPPPKKTRPVKKSRNPKSGKTALDQPPAKSLS